MNLYCLAQEFHCFARRTTYSTYTDIETQIYKTILSDLNPFYPAYTQTHSCMHTYIQTQAEKKLYIYILEMKKKNCINEWVRREYQTVVFK